MPPTIRSLAKLAGVSPATISLALRNDIRISAEVRKRVQELAQKEGYKPNPIVSQLIAQVRTGQSANYKCTLAVINTARHRKDAEEHTVLSWNHASMERAAELGYTVDHFVLAKEPMRPQRLAKVLETRGIKGLIVTGPFHDDDIAAKYAPLWERFAAIILGERPEETSLSSVINDQYNTVRQAMIEAYKLGYRKPALCVHPYVDEILEYRLSGGYLVELRTHPWKSKLMPFEYMSEGKDHFQKWFRQRRPDIILTLHTEIREWLEEIDILAPRDVGLIHLDHEPALAAWAGMSQNHHHAGKAAVDMLIGKIHRNETAFSSFPKCITIKSEWHPGPSVKQL
ncbi:MAG: LacI family DNA-binding transcriptional regulator [Verrucomicrobiota bacterium JB024]|nr:LacI family DNA-binding transcriptional regulator [Verrucomicrobiota bacterium JB024]